MSSDLAHLPKHAKVVITLIGGMQGSVFGVNSIANIEALVEEKTF